MFLFGSGVTSRNIMLKVLKFKMNVFMWALAIKDIW